MYGGTPATKANAIASGTNANATVTPESKSSLDEAARLAKKFNIKKYL